MVYFTCNACGQPMKKNQVEKHYTSQCRNCEVLSCVDCGKDFWGDDYKSHIRCISEEEKYSGPNYKPKPGANKGEKKQDEWIQNIQNAVSKIKDDPELCKLLNVLVTYNNIPRKQKKFEKFIENSVHVRNNTLVQKAWDVFNSAHNTANKIEGSNSNKECKTVHEAGKEQSSEKIKGEKKKKRKLEADNGAIAVCDEKTKRQKQAPGTENENLEEKNIIDASQNNSTKFQWKKIAADILRSRPQHEMKFKKLKKKMYIEYKNWKEGESVNKEELYEKIGKKINNKKFKVENDKIKLIEV